MLYLYRRVTNSLVDLGKLQANTTIVNVITGNIGEWHVFGFRIFSRCLIDIA